ncbi:hypothetical protein ACFOLJ_22565 [Rugamonas sp. CCM 8940]|uniref:hypothetical protein n=1 Tax=Rugamonas sp. CCM 8940 TaxID=2765359 RepID=UPI0018F4E747|nr:hypothetical protein [Rugamonas sp. CCM 8940]MBJ7312567.1 hypothetical protein [Rugamonas sp. CCM 8940]
MIEIDSIHPLVNGLTYAHDGLYCQQLARAHACNAFGPLHFDILMAMYYAGLHYPLARPDLRPSAIAYLDIFEEQVLERWLGLRLSAQPAQEDLLAQMASHVRQGHPVLVPAMKNFFVSHAINGLHGLDLLVVKGCHEASGNLVLFGNTQLLPFVKKVNCFVGKNIRLRRDGAQEATPIPALLFDPAHAQSEALTDLLGDVHCNYYEHALSVQYYHRLHGPGGGGRPSGDLQVMSRIPGRQAAALPEVAAALRAHLLQALEAIDALMDAKLSAVLHIHASLTAQLGADEAAGLVLAYLNSQSILYVCAAALAAQVHGHEVPQRALQLQARALADDWKALVNIKLRSGPAAGQALLAPIRAAELALLRELLAQFE